MTVDFSLRSSVFSEIGDLSASIPVHKMLLQAWRNAGRLRIFDFEAFVALISRLPGELRKLWFEALKDSSFPKLLHDFDPDSCAARADVERHGRVLDLLAISAGETEKFLSKAHAFADVCSNGVELARVEFISVSSRFKSATDGMTGLFEKDDDRSKIISKHLGRRLVSIDHFVLVDRYFLTNFSNNGALIQPAAEGLAELLKCMRKLKSVKIFSSDAGITCSPGQMSGRVFNFLSDLKDEVVKSFSDCPDLELIVNRDHRYKEEVHDRYFRFDRVTLDVGTGAEMLVRPRLHRSTNYTIGFKGDEYRRVYENRLSSTKVCSVSTED